MVAMVAQAPVLADNVWTGSNTTGATNRTGVVSIGTTNAPGTSSMLQINGGAAIGYSPTTNVPANGLMISGNVGVGMSPTDKFDVSGNMSIENNDIFLRSDQNHGIGWYGSTKLWNGVSVDGPVVYGYTAGLLGINQGGTRTNVLYWNKTGVGIGTTSPATPLQVNGINSAYSAYFLGANGSGTSYGVKIYAGTNTSDGAFYVANQAGTTPYLFVRGDGYVGIGTIYPGYPLAVNGKMAAKEVIVTQTGWSDFVFKDNYKLKPLNQVADYVKKNKHLEGVPTEAEVKKNGVPIGEMQAKLLEKVEELTLHMIEMQKQNDELKLKVSKLEMATKAK
jgi:hypothetical protein